MANLPVDFYLTGGTALSRAFLHHRYSDDLDFFVNGVTNFKSQVNIVLNAFRESGLHLETTVADEGYARIFIFDLEHSLKLDFVNDVPFRSGTSMVTPLFVRTDNLPNILSNKITALGRYSPKDVVDIVYICEVHQFNWESIINDASEKDLWVNPVNAAEVLERFPLEKIGDIVWIGNSPSNERISEHISQIIADILDGSQNSLYTSTLV
jgi:hypothetical protein